MGDTAPPTCPRRPFLGAAVARGRVFRPPNASVAAEASALDVKAAQPPLPDHPYGWAETAPLRARCLWSMGEVHPPKGLTAIRSVSGLDHTFKISQANFGCMTKSCEIEPKN